MHFAKCLWGGGGGGWEFVSIIFTVQVCENECAGCLPKNDIIEIALKRVC